MMWDPSNPYNITKNSQLQETGNQILKTGGGEKQWHEGKAQDLASSNPYDLYKAPQLAGQA